MIIKIISKVFKNLINNKKVISVRLFEKTLKSGKSQVGNVSNLIMVSISRFGQILKYLYINILLVIVTYVVIFINIIKDFIILNFIYVQNIGKYLIEGLMVFTGPLNENVLRNLWLIYVLSICIVVLYIMYKIVKYMKNIYNVYKINKENLKNEIKIELINLEKLEQAKELINFEKKLVEAKQELLKYEKKDGIVIEEEEKNIVNMKENEKGNEIYIPKKIKLGKIEYNFEKYLKMK